MLYLVSILEVEVTGFGVVAKVNPLSVVSNDILGSRVVVVSPLDQLQHPKGRESKHWVHGYSTKLSVDNLAYMYT